MAAEPLKRATSIAASLAGFLCAPLLHAAPTDVSSRASSAPRPSVVIDASWQDVPDRDGTSGVRHLTYVDQSYPVGATLADFHRLIPFHRLAVLLDRNLLEAIPQLERGVTGLVRAAGGEGVVVPAQGGVNDILASLPAGVDAVYLTPLSAMPESEYARLIAGLNARRLPTLSYTADVSSYFTSISRRRCSCCNQ